MKYPLRWSSFYFAYFSFIGLWISFGPSVLLRSSPVGAAASLALITLTYFVSTPFCRWLWIQAGFTRALRLLATGLFACLAASAAKPSLLVWMAPLAFFFAAGTYTLCETRMMEALVAIGRGHEFGATRKWGSLGFLTAAALGGFVLTRYGSESVFCWAMAACGFILWSCCLALPSEGDSLASGSPTLAAEADPGAEESEPDPAEPLAHPGVRHRFMGSAAICSMRLAEAIATSWFGAYWLSLGKSAVETGLLCSLPVAAEFLAMWRGQRILKNTPLPLLLLICSGASALRWVLTPLCTQASCAASLQAIHALSFGFFYPASLIWLKREFGEEFFHARYKLEAVSRAGGAAVSYCAAAFAISSFGFGPLFYISAGLAAASSLWWMLSASSAPMKSAL